MNAVLDIYEADQYGNQVISPAKVMQIWVEREELQHTLAKMTQDLVRLNGVLNELMRLADAASL